MLVIALKYFSKKALLQAEREADLIELRLDFLPLDAKRLLRLQKRLRKLVSKPLILTLRPKSQGGFFSGTEKERLNR
ncbi:MAG: type I 3-dehydroquinate dehydratase, partial [Parachlamydiales bacterium]